MAEKFIVKVAVDHIVFHLDKLYDYIVPDEWVNDIKPGCRVLVPFGIGNKKRQGIVLQKAVTSDFDKIKTIFAVLDKAPLLNDEMLRLSEFIKQKYFCTIFDAVKLMVPTGLSFKLYEQYRLCNEINEELFLDCTPLQKDLILYFQHKRDNIYKETLISKFGASAVKALEELEEKNIIEKKEIKKRNIGDAKVKMVKLSECYTKESIKLTTKQKIVYDFLTEHISGVSIKELNYFTGVGITVIDNLVKKGLVVYFENEIYRDPYKDIQFAQSTDEIVLTDEQNKAYKSIYEQYKSGEYKVSLLYGITGSGKTSVFMKVIDDVVNDGKNVIVMVPEIALTPQMVSIFKGRFNGKVAVFHSGLSQGERLDEYKKVKDGVVNVVVGTRSAVFAPFENVGLIIMDEEQEYSYKSDSTPRFHARDVAKFRCFYHKSLLLLSSATPSIESFFFAQHKKYNLNFLKNRYAGAKLPEVTIVDMNKEIENGNFSAFSLELKFKILENLKKKQQSILLLNRRGYNTFVSCRTCSEVVTCPNCSISLTYHLANKKLMCHYCGFSMDITDECPNCHEHQLKYMGLGTQKIEQDLNLQFPKARILRMDADTMTSRFSYDKKLKEFENGEYDIMLGTQMVAKGLNFPNVTLVGVLSADQSLYSEDFRSYERAFSLLTQVVGRSGRAKDAGSAIIQTLTPENPIIRLAAKQDYDSFYNDEIKIRQAMLYPPFANICVIGFVGKKEQRVLKAAVAFFKDLKDIVNSRYSYLAIRVLGPSPAQVLKVNNKYRYKIIVKFKDEKSVRMLIKELLIKFGKYKEYSNVSVFFDVNPDVIL